MYKKIDFFWLVLLAIAAGSFFTALLYTGIKTDIPAHAYHVVRTLNGDIAPPANFLYFLLVGLLAYTQSPPALWPASIFLLTIAVVGRYHVTKTLFDQERAVEPEGWLLRALPFLFSGGLVVAFSLPPMMLGGRYYYLGQIPPVVWHNSTTIFLFPFSLLLFASCLRQLKEPTTKGSWWMLLLIVLNVLIKPSYFFVVVVVFPLFLLYKHRLNRSFFKGLWPVVLGGLFLLAEYVLIFKFGLSNAQGKEVGITVDPFLVWSRFSNNLPLSLLVSV